jgi:hypothetical protein
VAKALIDLEQNGNGRFLPEGDASAVAPEMGLDN